MKCHRNNGILYKASLMTKDKISNLFQRPTKAGLPLKCKSLVIYRAAIYAR